VEATTHRNIPITTPLRTIIDLAQTLNGRPLEQALDRAEQRRLIDFAELHDRPIPPSLQAVLSLYTAGTPTRSELEERFLQLCDDHGLPRPQVNTRINGIEVDFVWPQRRLIVEVDGYAYHPRPQPSRPTANATSTSREPAGASCASPGTRSHAAPPGSPARLTCDHLVTYAQTVTTDDDRVFKALADPTRRFLLDRLFARDGRTLTELESELEMTRFGVMKHLRVLEDAGLVVARKSGREKLHYLNPVPIRLIHDRWIDKYTERQVSALVDLKTELEGTA
jgi:DNA-binding transcriptional ArsR family regulator